jgi:hypothetical protein
MRHLKNPNEVFKNYRSSRTYDIGTYEVESSWGIGDLPAATVTADPADFGWSFCSTFLQIACTPILSSCAVFVKGLACLQNQHLQRSPPNNLINTKNYHHLRNTTTKRLITFTLPLILHESINQLLAINSFPAYRYPR